MFCVADSSVRRNNRVTGSRRQGRGRGICRVEPWKWKVRCALDGWMATERRVQAVARSDDGCESYIRRPLVVARVAHAGGVAVALWCGGIVFQNR